MNDRRFVELLNLYVDDQLAPAEAAELEAAVLSNPARRRTYDEYCRLHRGCSLLCDGARTLAPSSQGFARSLRDAERKMAAPRRRSWFPAYAGVYGGTALAACVAVILLVNRQSPESSSGVVIASLNNPPAIVTAERVPSAVTVSVAAPSVGLVSPLFDVQPVVTAAVLDVARNAREVEIASADREALEWMQRVDLLPLQRLVIDEQAFESRPTLQPDNRVFRSRHSLQGSAEFTAFQFQR